MKRSITRFVSACCLFATAATAQLAGPGLSWSGTAGEFARAFVPSCANLPVVVVPGEVVTVTVWGDMLAPYCLLAAASGNQCVTIPGLGNGLILDWPITTVAFGLLAQTTPCLSCPPGLENLVIPIPAWLPAGTTLSFQGASLGASHPAFTVAITGTV